MNKKHFVYIVECEDGSYYTGYTSDLMRRMKEHRTGKGAKYIKGRGFKKLVFYAMFGCSSEAIKMEHKIKKFSRKKKEKLVKNWNQNTYKY